MNKLILKNYRPHIGQEAFHYAIAYLYQYVLAAWGIRAGKTFMGAREATKQAWNAKGPGAFGIIAPTFSMLKRTTWVEFKEAARPLIMPNSSNDSDFILTLRNGRKVHGHTAEHADRIRNETFVGAWVDEARECKTFGTLWNVLLGRVLSTHGKIFVTTSPNSFDDIHRIFIEQKNPQYGIVRFKTHNNPYLDPVAIAELEAQYDSKFAQQELYGEFVIFEGTVYYTFNRQQNAGDLAFKMAQYDADKPLRLCCDFNVDPMAWVICQFHEENKIKTIRVIDEIYLKNSNTIEACDEFKLRYPNHSAGLYLYGDATGTARHSSSNITNWKIIENELVKYHPMNCVPLSNPGERDRINSVNGIICNSQGLRRTLINPQTCKNFIRDLEQVSFKEGSVAIDKTRNFSLTHASDAFGYMAEREFSLNRGYIKGLKI